MRTSSLARRTAAVMAAAIAAIAGYLWHWVASPNNCTGIDLGLVERDRTAMFGPCYEGPPAWATPTTAGLVTVLAGLAFVFLVVMEARALRTRSAATRESLRAQA